MVVQCEFDLSNKVTSGYFMGSV